MKLFCLFVFYFLSLKAFAADKVLMAVLVKVDKVALTTRDLQINQFMTEYDNILVNVVDKREPLKDMVLEHLLAFESQSLLKAEDVSKDYAEYEKEFYNKVSKDSLWKTMDVSVQEVKTLLTHRLAAKKLIQIKIPVDLMEVSDKELESYYLQNKTQLGNRPFDEIKPKLIKGLRDKKAQTRFKDWMTALARSHQVTYMSGFRIQ